MAMVNTSGMMDQCMKVCGTRTKLMAVESIFGQMEENMTVNGKTTICMVKVSTLGRTEECIKDSMRTIASTDMVHTPGTMANNTQVGGKMESNMEKEPTAKTAVIEKVYGKMVKE